MRQRIVWTINRTNNRKRTEQERGSYFQIKQGGQGEKTRQRKTDYKKNRHHEKKRATERTIFPEHK
jgi:hypothetical protein